MDLDRIYSRELYISTNLTCNLKCIYCFERYKKDFSFDIDEAYEKLSALLSIKTPHGTKIKLLGGEPFLIFDKIKSLCERIWNSNFEEKYLFYIATNGTLVHGDIQTWLMKNKDKFSIKLSIDGSKVSQDINRPNSFKRIDIPFFVNTWPNVRINMAVTPQTLPYFAENIKFFHSVGLNNILINFALMTDWGNKKLEKVFYNQLSLVLEFYLNNPQYKPCSLFQANITSTLFEPNGAPSCGIGKKDAYDFYSKKYYPCHMFFPSVCGFIVPDEIRLGDYSKREEFESKTCLKCRFINICRTCYAENYAIRGHISFRDMNLCIYQKITFVFLFRYEYFRIINLSNPNERDIKKMQAIQKCYSEISKIEERIKNL